MELGLTLALLGFVIYVIARGRFENVMEPMTASWQRDQLAATWKDGWRL